MSQAYQCDMCGRLIAGEAAKIRTKRVTSPKGHFRMITMFVEEEADFQKIDISHVPFLATVDTCPACYYKQVGELKRCLNNLRKKYPRY